MGPIADPFADLSLSNEQAIMHVQKHLNVIEKLFNMWRIKANPEKKTYNFWQEKKKNWQKIFYKFRKRKHIKSKSNQIFRYHIRPTSKILSPGQSSQKKITINVRTPLSTMNKYSAQCPALKLLLYKQLIRPIMSYATPVWRNTYKTHIKNLQTIQNKSLRLVVNNNDKNEAIHKDLNIPTIL